MNQVSAMNPRLNEREATLQVFAAEAQEILAGMEGALAALETCPDDREMLDSFFQSVRRLECSAERASYDPVRELTWELAALLERLCALATPLGAVHVSLLQRTLDTLLESTVDAVINNPKPRPEVAALREQLARATSTLPVLGSGTGHRSIDRALRSVVAGVIPKGNSGAAGRDQEEPSTPKESESGRR